MGNSSSQSTVPQHMADKKKPLATQMMNRAHVAGKNTSEHSRDPRSPSTGIPRSSFCSRLLVRNGKMLVCGMRLGLYENHREKVNKSRHTF